METRFSLKGKEKEYICKNCGTVFWTKSRGKEPKYCSDKCRCEAWKKYMRKYMRRRRLNKKLKTGSLTIEEFDRKLAEFIRIEKNIIEWTDEMSERMTYLVTHQQFANNITLDNKCWVCESKENLVQHHVSYIPTDVKVLCRSCHEFLHKVLLNGRKCKPKIIK